MKYVVSGSLSGVLAAQPSKSMAHRALICAALSRGRSRVENIRMSDDIVATARCATALGLAEISVNGSVAEIDAGVSRTIVSALLDCGESGSTMRFFLPIAPIFSKNSRFTGKGRLMERPVEPLKSLLVEKGLIWKDGCELSGSYAPGDFSIRGDVSSQFISGLLFALPLLGGDSRIILTSPPESEAYIELTRSMQRRFGILSSREGLAISVKGGQSYKPADVAVEGDWSHAAFYAVAGATGGDITVTGLDMASLQPDRAVLEILRRMGARIELHGDGFSVSKSKLHGASIDGSQCPDIVPVLAVAACAANGTTRIFNAARLRLKECDRLSAMAEDLKILGADISETPDGLEIKGGRRLCGGAVSAFGDHRIAMSMAVAAAITDGGIEIGGAESVSKSAPDFWEEYTMLGGKKE